MPLLAIAPEVADAIGARRPVVALESTLITHGLPRPEGLAVALAAERAVRDAGAVPATVALWRGALRVGLSPLELEELASAGAAVHKAGVADLAPLLAAGLDGSTTVSATVFAAARAGIRLMATGGIGGVHRGDAGDVSSDLPLLAREAVAVVCAGAKAILDLPRTLELLETLGVPVVGLGTRELPGFYTASTGLPLEIALDTPAEVARLVAARFALGQGGVLVVRPPPVEGALSREETEQAVGAALARAAERGVRGKALTPFLLAEIAALTAGRSVAINRALIVANAGAAGKIASALHAPAA